MTRTPWLLCGLAAGILLASAVPSWPSVVDDAYVSLRYARNLALGNGLVYNAGQPPVEGYTNFLWVLLMAPGTLLPVHPSSWATAWGFAFAVVGLCAATGVTRVLCGRGSSFVGVPALTLACLPVYAIAATNGLETSMYVAGVLAASWAVLDGRRPWLAGVLAGLLYLVRPEGLLVGGALVLLPLLTARDARPLAALGLVVVPYFVARTAYFGTLIPNTFNAQAREPLLDMIAMNADYLRRSRVLYAGAVVAWLVAVALGPRTAGRYLLLALAAALTLVALRVYNWMPGARLFLAPIALTLVALPPALQRLPRAPRGVATTALVAWTLYLSVGPSRAAETRYDARNTALPDSQAERMARALAAIAEPGDWLLARDAGVVPYFAGPVVSVIDIHPYSLTDPALTGKPLDLDHVLAVNPRWIVTTGDSLDELPSRYGSEKLLLADRRVRGHYTRTVDVKQHHKRFYALWTRDPR